jgi:hypothetical protein
MQNIVASYENGTVELSHNIVISKSSSRQSFESNQKYVLNPNLVDKNNIYLQPLRIELETMKNFVKDLDINEAAFGYLKLKFPILSYAKIEESIVIPFINYCPQIHQLIQNLEFENKMILIEKKHG